ncbi:MAG: hypothetical protein JXM70_13310 [Pirellulales bacterium]|nr:hypothetical protein [Pirellulales bacterium]
MKITSILFSFVTILWASMAVATINVDGDLNEWGISPASYNFNGNLLTPSSSVYTLPGEWSNTSGYGYHGQATLPGGEIVYYHAEDTSGDYLGPERGGQNYDTEYLGAVLTSSKLYIALSTGQRQDNGKSYFAPGDFHIVVADSDIYGIEVGGGVGGSGATAINLGDSGSTYNLNYQGYTNWSNPLASINPLQTAGSVWQANGTNDWYIENVGGYPHLATQLLNGNLTGNADAYVYNFESGLGTHAFIELCVDLDLLGDPPPLSNMKVAWRPSCGNDEAYLCVEIPSGPPPQVPEPSSFIVWGILISLACVGSRRLRKRLL